MGTDTSRFVTPPVCRHGGFATLDTLESRTHNTIKFCARTLKGIPTAQYRPKLPVDFPNPPLKVQRDDVSSMLWYESSGTSDDAPLEGRGASFAGSEVVRLRQEVSFAAAFEYEHLQNND